MGKPSGEALKMATSARGRQRGRGLRRLILRPTSTHQRIVTVHGHGGQVPRKLRESFPQHWGPARSQVYLGMNDVRILPGMAVRADSGDRIELNFLASSLVESAGCGWNTDRN